MADASNVFKVRSGHVGYLSKLTKEAAKLLQDQSDDKRLGFLTYAIKDQFAKYRSVTEECLTKVSDKQLFDLKSHDENVFKRVNELSTAINDYLGNELPEPPSPEELAQESPDIVIEETEDPKTPESTHEQAHPPPTEMPHQEISKPPSVHHPRSFKAASKGSSAGSTANEKRAKAQVEAQVAALKLKQKKDLLKIKEQQLRHYNSQ